jgi:exoribonuclease-2
MRQTFPSTAWCCTNGARQVVKSGERLEIEMDDGNRARVRPKDITLLHPGPLRSLTQLQPSSGEVELAWQILLEGGEAQPLAELAELIYGDYTPTTAWAAWGWVEDGMYFHGSLEAVTARTQAEVESERAARQDAPGWAWRWAAFLERKRASRVSQDDARYLRELENLAFGRSRGEQGCARLGAASARRTPTAAAEWKAWDESVNPTRPAGSDRSSPAVTCRRCRGRPAGSDPPGRLCH